MLDKKNLIMIGIVGAAGFASSLILGMVMSKRAPQPPQSQTPAQEQKATLEMLPTPAGEPVSLSPAKKQLDELIRDVKKTEMELKDRERKLKEQEKQVQLAQEDLKKQIGKLEALKMEIEAPRKQLKDALEELESKLVVIEKEEDTQLKKIAGTFQGMDPTKAAEALTSMSRNGQIKYVVKLLSFMEPRSSAKVMNEITDNDPETSAKLVGIWKQVRQSR